jgi:hypothetical protein
MQETVEGGAFYYVRDDLVERDTESTVTRRTVLLVDLAQVAPHR